MSLFPNIKNAIAPSVMDKLKGLYKLLNEGKAFYEKIALKSQNKQLQRTIIGLAQESNQYASEVSSQIYCMGGGFYEQFTPYQGNLTENDEDKNGSDIENISAACDISERKLISFYKELLEETSGDPYLFSEVREMIKYQMKGFKYTLSQLKLLQLTS